MSGIFGALSLDGGELSPEQIEPMAALLARRGPDGTRIWHQGGVALGQALLATTPEALVEQLPLTDPDSGCTITADVRLDNRAELMAALGLGGETRVVGDGELILRAYLRWGEDCPKHLLGDFAFAIWDPRARQLYCARDHMGMRQLVYHHHPGRHFVFATEARGVLAHPGVPRRVNEARIADFLQRMEGIDFTSTFYQQVFRLPPAHGLRVTADAVLPLRYWRLRARAQLELGSSEDYVHAFREVFTEAVRCRLRSHGSVGCLLSGGLDSNSVAAVAARLLDEAGAGKLHTFSGTGNDPRTCRETRFISCAIANPAFRSYTVRHDRLGPLRTILEGQFEASPNPFDAHMTMVGAAYSLAHDEGVRVVLDGAGSDLVLASGNPVARLLQKGRLRDAMGEARSDAAFWSDRSLAGVLLGAAWVAFAPRNLRRLRQALHSRVQSYSGRRVNQRLAAKVGLGARMLAYRRLVPPFEADDRSYRVAQIGHPHTAAGRERYNRVASAFAVEPRDPFLDIRVIQFCLSLPAEQLRSAGWPKLVLRRAMTGLVPEEILERRGKEHVGSAFSRELFEGAAHWQAAWPRLAASLKAFVRPSLLRRAPPVWRESAGQDARAMDLDTFIELFAIGCWLERNDVPRV